MQVKIIQADYHRNGISGLGFYAILFDWQDEDGKTRRMVASLFDEDGACAVYDVEKLAKGNILMSKGNAWRGDHFEPTLRKLVATAVPF